MSKPIRLVGTGVIALLCIPSVFAQQGHWEIPVLMMGDANFQFISTEHLVHVFNGVEGKFMALAEEEIVVPNDFCPHINESRGRIYLWKPPVMNQSGVVHLKTFGFAGLGIRALATAPSRTGA
jgi:hypothetical protein